jgi:hypothetical protein
MAREFRVVDCRSTVAAPADLIVVADTPEHAARLAIGEDLVRGTGKSHLLRARVYSHDANGLTMVRLYTRVADVVPHLGQSRHWGD